MTSLFVSPAQVRERLAAVNYLADASIATTVFLADALGKPLLVEGPAGVGKTELAKAVAAVAGAHLVRLQCYEGLDEARALYEWNYKKQLLRIQAAPADRAWEATHDDIFTEEFLLARPLLTAIRRADPTVLLIDETDKADVEFEGLLLEVLSDFQVTIPELGTVRASAPGPFVVLTSNATRELSEALKRRCLYLHLGYPSAQREREIVLAQVPGLEPALAEQLVRTVATLRALELKKAPSIARPSTGRARCSPWGWIGWMRPRWPARSASSSSTSPIRPAPSRSWDCRPGRAEAGHELEQALGPHARPMRVHVVQTLLPSARGTGNHRESPERPATASAAPRHDQDEVRPVFVLDGGRTAPQVADGTLRSGTSAAATSIPSLGLITQA
jgi:MoxR-like ATPase